MTDREKADFASVEVSRLRFALAQVAYHARCRERRDRNPADCIDAAVRVATAAVSGTDLGRGAIDAVNGAASTVFAVFMPWWMGGTVDREAAREALFGLERAISRLPTVQPEATSADATAPDDPRLSKSASFGCASRPEGGR